MSYCPILETLYTVLVTKRFFRILPKVVENLTAKARQDNRSVVSPTLWQSGSMVSDDARISLRNALINFSSWHPYRSPNRLVQVGMNENEVENIAGQPDEKEFYTDTRQGRFIAIAGWYYANSDRTQITLLEFEIGTRSLIRIASRP